MRAIKINVVEKTITEISINGNVESMYAALECDTFTRIAITRNESLWVDDEGLLKDIPLGAFRIEGYDQSLSGHGLIIGLDAGGNNVGSKISIEWLASKITFVGAETLPEPKITFHTIGENESFKDALIRIRKEHKS